MLRKKIIAALSAPFLVFAISDSMYAQDSTVTEESAFKISGSVDAYYKYDFAKMPGNTFTSFTKTHNDFSLGMASVKFEHTGKKVSAVADLGFGPRAKEFSYTDDGITQAIKQLYINYSPTSWLKLSAGTWATHCNWELVDAFSNRNYSMSYQFTIGPFSHTGLRADITSGKSAFMVGVSNATDYRISPQGQINKKFFIAQYAYAPNDNLKFYMNYVGGQAPDTSKSNFFNLIATAKVSDKFNIVYNGIYTGVKQWDGTKNLDDKAWWGSSLYLNFDPQPWFGLTLRGELFNDKNQLNVFSGAPVGGSIFATTLSANFKKGGFIFIPEIRFDNGSENVFVDKNGAASKSMGNFLFAAIYSF